MASTSSQSLSVPIHPPPDWRYDVFLSFRGADTRNSFTAHLYSALIQMGINAYKDDRELERGKTIEPELWKAIGESMFSIIIFSNNYASSPWCLDELVEIIRCMKTRRQTVLPIFYDVDPSDVADQKGSYEKAFVAYGEEFEDNKEKVKTWKDALSDAANLSGWDVRDRDQSEIIKEIVDKVWYDVRSIPLINDKTYVGMNFHVMMMKRLLGEDQQMDVRLIGICGMGGVGKTTIAQVIHDRICRQFKACCFLANVKKARIDFLQEQILFEITGRQHTKVRDAKSGAFEIQKSLKNKKVLMIFDDVDDLEQLEMLVGEKDWFGPGSRVIITSRDRHLLSTHGVDAIYDVKVLNDDDALVLLSRKAFKQDQPPEDYLDLSKLVLAHVEGLPLALSVLGSFLNGRSLTEWRDAIDRLHKNPDEKIINVLRISFDGLKESEQQIFLDIACCFKGEDKEWVTAALDACGLHATIGMPVLIEKSLVSISEYGEIQMHELLQVMGRNIIKQESRNDPGRSSRLWDLDDIRQVFDNITENKEVEIVFSKGIDWHLNLEVLSKLSKLRILKLDWEVAFEGRLTHISNELRYFDWYDYPFKSLPSSFQPKKLVELHLNSNKIERLWDEYRVLNCLKILNLSSCNNLVETPDFTGTPNLEKLCLSFCKKLSKLHPSFHKLKRLIEVDLHFCESLKQLATSIEAEGLQILDIDCCRMLNKFPIVRGVMPSLYRLCLNYTDLRTLPDSIQNLVGLVSLELRECTNLQCLPSSIGHLKMLEELDLYGCSNLIELPEDICQLTSLKSLELRSTGIRRLPRSIFFLKNLKEIHCGGYQKVRESKVLVIPSLSGMVSLERLELSYCNLGEGSIPEDIRCLPKLSHLDLTGNNFVILPESIIQLDKLLELILEDCRMLRALPEIPPNVCILSTNGCICLEEIVDPMKLQNSESLVFKCFNCMKLYENNGGDHFASKMIQQYLKNSSVPRSRFNIVVPGRKIPRWFTNQTKGRFITMPTPTDILCDSSCEWMGLAVCVLFKTRNNDLQYVCGLSIRCRIYCTENNNEVELDDSLDCIVNGVHIVGESAHCWSFFVSLNQFKKMKIKSTSDLRFEFRLLGHTKIQRCYVRLVSFQDIQELKTVGDSCEDYDIDGAQDDTEESSAESELSSHLYYPRRPGFFERIVYFVCGK